MTDPFYEGYLAAAESRPAGRHGVRSAQRCDYALHSVQHRVWMDGFYAYFADVTRRPPGPKLEPELA